MAGCVPAVYGSLIRNGAVRFAERGAAGACVIQTWSMSMQSEQNGRRQTVNDPQQTTNLWLLWITLAPFVALGIWGLYQTWKEFR